MEHERFDALATSLANDGSSRRTLLSRLLIGGAATALGLAGAGLFGADDAEARNCRKKCKKKKTARKRRRCRKRCGASSGSCVTNANCAGGQMCINARCTSTCTGSGQCASGQVCVNGACVTGCVTAANCPGGQTCVNGGCTVLCTDSGDCTGGQQCIEGVCGTPNTPPDDPAVNLCVSSTQCPDGICITGVCVAGCTTDADCTGALVCGNLLGSTGPRVCIAPSTPCGPQTPCTGSVLSACVLGICLELG